MRLINMVRLDLSELTALYEGLFAKIQDLLKELLQLQL